MGAEIDYKLDPVVLTYADLPLIAKRVLPEYKLQNLIL